MQKRVINIFLFINILVGIYLTISAFLFSWKNIELTNEYVYKFNDGIITNILFVIVCFAVIAFLIKREIIISKISTKKIAIIFSVLAVIISIIWVITTKTAPQADSKAVCYAAMNFNAGDYTDLARGEYVAKYPQQLGLITVMRVLFKLFGDYNYLSFQLLSCLAVFPIVYCTYEIISILSNQNKKIELIGIAIAFLCLPLYMYTSYVYGEILSTAFIVIAFMLLMKCYNDFSIAKLVMLALTVMFAVMIRQNSVIAIIAMVGVVIFKAIVNDKRKVSLLLALAIMVGVMSHSILIKALYDKHWPDDATHLPATLWIAMGTNNDILCAGWNNGLGSIVFEESGYDEQASKDAAAYVIKSFKKLCLDNPSFAVDFYNRKITSQWCAPMYQGIVMNSYIEGEQSVIAHEIFYNQRVWHVFDAFMNIYQLIVYISILGLMIHCLKKDYGLEFYVGLITVFGGFLFSIIWEAKTRYIFPYLIMMLPYAAIGAYMLASDLDILKDRFKQRIKRDK